jgi:adenine C2-methylase RlmN of 23S rRNA A2503 and tRNA A37
MGEPSLNIDNVIETIKTIKSWYPNARIQISTIGIHKSIELVDRLLDLEKILGYDWLELQFSIHSTDSTFRKWLQHKTVMLNKEIGALADRWYSAHPNRPWKATLNFALSKETPFIIGDLKEDFNPKSVFIKISPINENPVSNENSLETLFRYENTI